MFLFRNNSFKSVVAFELFANYDAILYVRGGACNASYPNEVCNDDDFFSASYIELVDVQPGDYYIFVEGYNGAAGAFELDILF